MGKPQLSAAWSSYGNIIKARVVSPKNNTKSYIFSVIA